MLSFFGKMLRTSKPSFSKTRKMQRGKPWSAKYKKSINCNKPRGFSQRQYCKYGRNRKTQKARK